MRRTRILMLCAAFIVLAPLSPTRADSLDREVAAFASGRGNILYLTVGVGLPLLTDGGAGGKHALGTLDALATGTLLGVGLKALTREKRPDADAHDSFPSGHATAAFAVAAMESQWHPRQALLWYGAAALIGDSRLRLHRHYLQDVLAGAALGYGVTRLEQSHPRHLILTPLTYGFRF